MIENTRKTLIEFGKSLDQEQHKEILRVLNQAEEIAKGDNLEATKAAATDVEAAAAKLTESLMAMA